MARRGPTGLVEARLGSSWPRLDRKLDVRDLNTFDRQTGRVGYNLMSGIIRSLPDAELENSARLRTLIKLCDDSQ